MLFGALLPFDVWLRAVLFFFFMAFPPHLCLEFRFFISCSMPRRSHCLSPFPPRLSHILNLSPLVSSGVSISIFFSLYRIDMCDCETLLFISFRMIDSNFNPFVIRSNRTQPTIQYLICVLLYIHRHRRLH